MSVVPGPGGPTMDATGSRGNSHTGGGCRLQFEIEMNVSRVNGRSGVPDRCARGESLGFLIGQRQGVGGQDPEPLLVG